MSPLSQAEAELSRYGFALVLDEPQWAADELESFCTEFFGASTRSWYGRHFAHMAVPVERVRRQERRRRAARRRTWLAYVAFRKWWRKEHRPAVRWNVSRRAS